MADSMIFPDTWEEYEQSYGFTDTEEIYTNGARLIPSFRVAQWLSQFTQSGHKKGEWLRELERYTGGYPRFIYHCSKCGYAEEHAYVDSKCSNFCPNCGADMRGKE